MIGPPGSPAKAPIPAARPHARQRYCFLPGLWYTNAMWPRIALGALGLLLFRVGAGFFSRVWFVLRQLWHEIVGFLFLVLALAGASTTFREWRAGSGGRILLAAGFTLMMAYFGITSFRSARKVRHQGESRHS